jgi:CheY-like chemotaxis protein
MKMRSARILVADDDPDLLRTVAHSLEVSGAHVTCATNGADLIALIGEDEPFDLVIADISMPWMTGLQAMHSATYAGLATPILIITALKDERIPEQVKALGTDSLLLRKPFGLDELDAAVTTLLSAAR